MLPRIPYASKVAALGLAMAFTQAAAEQEKHVSVPVQAQDMALAFGDRQLDHLKLYDQAIAKLRREYFSAERVEALADDIAQTRNAVVSGDQDAFEAVDSIVQKLDPHSSFSELNEDEMGTKGFSALGLKPALTNEGIRIDEVYFNSRAILTGLLEGDVITAINGKRLSIQKPEDVHNLVCNDNGDQFRLSVLRQGDVQPRDFNVDCDYTIKRVVSSRILNNHIGYVRVDEFAQGSADDVRDSFNGMKAYFRDMKGFILDLRNNPGGYVHEAQKMIDLFVDSSKPIFMENIRGRKKPMEFHASRGDILKDKPLVVLVNHASWSAAELTAMALQYQYRALIVGTTTAGKGSVQRIETMMAGVETPMRGPLVGSMRMTVGLYVMPDGASPQVRGVIPDIVVREDAPLNAPKREADFKNVFSNPGGAFTHAVQSQNCELPSLLKADFAQNYQKRPDFALACAMKEINSRVPSSQAKAAALAPR